MAGESDVLEVMVIDDDAAVGQFLHGLLSADGCHVTYVANPLQALAMLETSAKRWHILIIDLRMPGIDGMSLLGRVRKLDREIAAIILTAYPSLDSATDAIELDAAAYMQKPFSGEEMRETIARVARTRGIAIRREDQFHVAVAERIRDIRRERQLTIKQFARRTNMSVAQLSQIERAETSATLSALFKISNALGVGVDELVRGA